MAKSKKRKVEENSETVPSEKAEETNEPSPSPAKSKKKKKHKENLNVKVEVIGETEDKVLPVVGYLPSSYGPTKNRGEEEADGGESGKEDKVRLYRNKIRTKRMQLVVSPNKSEVDFVGTNYSGEATTSSMCNYALGVLDKLTRTLKIVPIAADRIIRLEPIVRGQDQVIDETSAKQNRELTAEERAGRLRELDAKYATKKSIREGQKRDLLRQTEDAETQQDLNLEDSIKINSDVLEVAATTNDARNIPPHDLGATTPETVYPLDKIIFKGEWDHLGEILQLLEAEKGFESSHFPSFVCNRVHKLDTFKNDEDEKWRLAGIFSYITHLIKFKDRHSQHYQSAKDHKIPKILSKKFNDMFDDPDSKWLRDDKRDLLINYVLVLTLHADDFRTDPSDIAKDLRMDAGALRRHYEFLGCKLLRNNRVLLASLNVPLQFPTVRKQRGKRQN